MAERIQKVFSSQGIASRRKTEAMIETGRIKINGEIAKMGDKIDLEKDEVFLNNEKINFENKKRKYYLVNKPKDFTCTTRSFDGEKKVIDLVPKDSKVWPVGRLDKNSRGLILLTDDGDLTQVMTHPKFQHKKEYLVTVNKDLERPFLRSLKKGIQLEEGLARADKVEQLDDRHFKMTLHQGLNRQIRRM